MRRHGINSTYVNGGCRCGPCTDAHRLSIAAGRERLAARPRDEVPHGISGYVNWACRCQVCTGAGKASNARYRAWTASRA